MKKESKQKKAKVVKDDEFEELRIGDVIYQTKLNKMYKDRKAYKIPNKQEIYSFIPGTIVEINIKEGDKVKKEEILMLLEAMKMKNQVLAPMDGIVDKIYVKKGQIIKKNFLMIKLKR